MLDAFLNGFVSGASRKLGEKAGEKAVDIVSKGFGNFGQSSNLDKEVDSLMASLRERRR